MAKKDKDKKNEKDAEKKGKQGKDEQEVNKPEYKTIINTKMVPSICMLLAGIVRAIFGIVYRDDIKSFLWSLVLVMIVFYILGFIIKSILDRNFREMIEDAVVEKTEEEKELENIEETDAPEDEDGGFIQEKQPETMEPLDDADSFE